MTNRISLEQKSRRVLEFEANDYTGGFVSQAATYNIDARFLSDIQNMEIVQGMWQKRKGYHLSGSFAGINVINPKSNRGLHVFKSNDNLHLLGVYGTTLYDTYLVTKEAAGRIVTNSLPDVPKFRFCDYRNDCYIANGKDNVLKFNGQTISEIASPPGSIITSYDGRLMLAGIKGDPMVIYFSDQGSGERWNPLNYILVESGSNERITGLIPLQGKLYIFTNQSIYSLVGNMKDFSISKEVNGIGAVSPEAIQVFGNRFYFIMGNGNIYEYDGGNFPIEISTNIRSYIQSNFSYNHFKNCATTFYVDGVWFTLDNSTDPKKRITIVYYPDYQSWTKFVGIPAASYVHIENTLFFTGTHNEGSIYQFGTQYLDELDFIEGFFKTTRYDFEYLENLKRFKEIYIRGAIQGGGSNGFDIDFIIDRNYVATVRATSDTATATEIWGDNQWGSMYWGYASQTSGAVWSQSEWGNFDWAGSEIKYSPKWGNSVWGSFTWGEYKEGSLPDDVGFIYKKIYLSQYNIISGKTLQLVFKDRSPNHGFRFENLLLKYIQKGVR